MLKSLRVLLPVLALLNCLLTAPVRAQVSLTTLGTPYTQSFDSLPATASATWTNNSTIPGWFHARTGTGTTIVANNGSSNAGNLYSYGTGTATDRALGSVGSGNVAVGNLFWGLRLQNNTGATITQLDVSYTGEEWRMGGCTPTPCTSAAQTVTFSYLVGSPTVTGTLAEFQTAGVAVPALNFTSPVVGPSTGVALDGNLTANRVTLTFSISGLSIPNGTEVMLRWSDPDHTNSDHGLSIDDLSVTPQGSPNAPVVPSCPASLATVFGTAASAGVSASDTDGTVTSATITGITPSDPGTITLTGFTPAGGVGGTANATLDVSNTTPVGSYNVTVQWANNDPSPQTATCAVAVSVTSISKIHDVQGSGAATPIPGATVTVEGVVTANFQGTGKLQGFFLQEEDTDANAEGDPATSEGIFIYCNSCPIPVAEGQRVRATGVVSEFNNMTEITASTAPSVVVTDAGNNLAQVTPAPIDLPVVGDINTFYEAREGMLVTFVDPLTVSEYFELARFGHIELFEGGRPRQFTEANPPSVAGNTAHLDNLDRRRVVLDDDNNRQNAYLPAFGGPPNGSQFIFHPRANGGFSVGTQGTDFFRGGDLVNGLTGVLHWSFPGTGADTWRIRPTGATPATFTVANPRPATAPAVGGAIKAAGMNLLNYFTTIDTGGTPCGPAANQECRGADSVAELNRQRARAALVVCTLNADVYGFAELENTTPSASITDLLGAVNTLCGGAHPYAFANTGGTLGTDAIRVQQIYRTGIVSPVGSPLSDLDPIHNRPPTAQTYDVVDAANSAFGQRFTVIVNHFKSKGSSAGLPGDADIGDGAGASNATRTAQASRLLTWINSTVVPAAGDPDVLLLGDFNAYAKEDPVNTLIAGGYTDLETLFHGANAYSYLFDGQLGHLDYGFASSSLLSQVTGTDAWHINADEAPLFDYNDEVFDSPGEASFDEKPDGSALVPPRVVFQPASPFRASDHDPVLVGLFQIADVSITKTDGVTTAVPGGSVTYTIIASNAGPDPVTGGTVTDTFPDDLTCTWTCVGAGGGTCTASGSGDISDTVNLPVGGSVTYTATCTIAASATGPLDNTASVSGGAAGDPDTSYNSATDSDTLTPQADLKVMKTDGVMTATPGGSVTYTIKASNSSGPSDAPGSTVTDTFPADLTCTWTCAGSDGGTCTASGSGDINDTVNLPAGGSVTYTASCTVSPAATGTLDNTATVAAPEGVTDPDSDNDSATDSDTVGTLGDYFTVTPCRAVDTRTGAPLQDGVPQTFALHGVCGIPTTATSVVLNVTEVGPTGSGDLTIYPGDATPPAFSTMPFPGATTRALIVVVPLSLDAAGEVAVNVSVAGSGTVHVVLDVMGYFE
ncbi:MAG TPA: ExeM/NucH family extracellular endonuclease [Thermoanaerobaculia bacterium]|nr:ExeM/NucH family extracellular endonuclease [Thermoanaerobaculia bacterium]